MPIYEFFCPQTNKIYSFYARSLRLAGKTPRCPDGRRYRMEKLMSSFAVTKGAQEAPAGGELGGTGEGAADDPRLERLMAEMAGEAGAMEGDEPDPRQLGRMMRKMTELGGGPVPEAVKEMIRRMEAGEDPEKLEAEYGDALEEFDPLGGEGGEGGAASKGRRRGPARRDPTLYEMADYVDEEGR